MADIVLVTVLESDYEVTYDSLHFHFGEIFSTTMWLEHLFILIIIHYLPLLTVIEYHHQCFSSLYHLM